MVQDTWVKNFLDRVMSIQSDVLYDFPEERRRQGYGRAARLIIDGSEGGIFELWFCEDGVKPKPADVPVKNDVYMTEETLLNLITPDADTDTLVALVEQSDIKEITLQLHPRLDFRVALANSLIVISGDKADVDSEEWAQIIERMLLKIAFPLVIRGLVKKKEGGK